jgi:hypothetical protein
VLEYLTFTYSGIEVGDFVERDEEIATIETDKVNTNSASPPPLPALLVLLLIYIFR